MASSHFRTAAAGLLVVGLVVGGCGSAATPSPALPSGSATATETGPVASPAPTTTPEPGLSWTATPFPGSVQAVTQDRGSLVAVGRDTDGLASWTSTDGVSWERHDVPDPTFIEGMLDDFGPQLYLGTQMGSLTRLGDTLFSFGTFYGPNDFYRPVGWRSPDGRTWEFIESDSEFYGYGSVTDADSIGDTLLAARTVGLSGQEFTIWNWRAGAGWRAGEVHSTNDLQVAVVEVAVADGAVLAAGNVATRTDAPQESWSLAAAGWWSEDGQVWQEISMPAEMKLAYQVASAPAGGFAVLGLGNDDSLATWHSADGSAWTPANVVCGPGAPCRTFTLARAGTWLVAITGNTGVGSIWLSRDGTSWDRQQIRPRRSLAARSRSSTAS